MNIQPKHFDFPRMLIILTSRKPPTRTKGSASNLRRLRWSSRAMSTLGAAMATGVLSAGQAQAQVVNVPGYGYWDVTTFLGSYDDNTVQFALPANGGVMPWWGSQTAAEAFANAVRNQLPPSSICDTCEPPTTAGPFFGYGTDVPTQPIQYSYFQYPTSNPELGGAVSTYQPGVFVSVWAQAAPAATTVPGPLPALGAAAAFGFSRKLRKRLKASRSVSSTAATV
ncbi:MAG: hypothetical protein RLZZ206_1141 [Cyanobacteriota bacterium]|jgi:hypothetical protein